MSADVKKLKDYITKLKEHVDTLALERPDRAIVLLLLAEVSLRGAVVANISFLEKDSSLDTGGIHGLLDQILSIAGKVMLDETLSSSSSSSIFPKPLVAGAATIAGTVAEKVAQSLLCFKESQTSTAITKSIFERSNPTHCSIDSHVLANVLKRCDDVNDSRLKALVSILFIHNDIPVSEVAALCMRISVGNTIRAAKLSNPDVPIMWKRALDSILVMHQLVKRIKGGNVTVTENPIHWQQLETETLDSYYNTDATIPLQKLISIAVLKGNKRRAAELRLHLVESLLSGLFSSSNLYKSSLLSDTGKKQWHSITSAFWSDQVTTTTNPLVDILNARETLQQFSVDTSSEGGDFVDDTMLLLYKHLRLGIELAHENYIVSCVAEQRHVAHKNRTAGMGGGLSSATGAKDELSTFLLSARNDFLAETLSNDEYDPKIFSQYSRSHVDTSAMALRDGLLSLPDFHHFKNELYRVASHSLCTYMNQLILRAQAIGTKRKKGESAKVGVHETWIHLMTFSAPIISYFSHDGYLDLPSLEDSQIIECAAQSYMSAHWMSFNALVDHGTDIVNACSIALSKCRDNHQQWLLKKRKLEETADAVKTISSTTPSVAEIELDISFTASRTYCILLRIAQKEKLSDHHSKAIDNSTKATLQMIKKSSLIPAISQMEVKYGFSFMQLLICWCGLHSSPWPFCTIVDARTVLRYVKSSISYLKSEWGRDLSEFESILLLLAEADCECGSLPGGYAPVALTLYNQTKAQIERLELRETFQNVNPVFLILKSHAMLGLSMLKLGNTLSQGDSIQDAEETGRASLALLQQIKAPDSMSTNNFYVFGDDSFDKILQYHICISRQLVAESLLRQDKFSVAHEFLVQAVQEAPANFQVAFDLASFTLRMSLYDNIFSFGNKQVSQIQLLKALKLDNEKADPYALIGVFYEAQLDTSRAFGFYSKTLIADPCNPVAGRGILRLKEYADIKQLCEVASSISSPNNGWAWAAIGRAKSLVDGDDPGGILCFQQSLRCKDIDSPETQKLAIFFNLPRATSNQNRRVSEKALVWSSLASCYRRLGKYSAALRAYRSALESSNASADVHCQMAQVLLELGMVQEAEQNFRMASACTTDPSLKYTSTNGMAHSLLDRARVLLGEGKFGFSLSQLIEGIERLKKLPHSLSSVDSSYFLCSLKLLGDLYSFGSFLPDSAFEDNALNKLGFIAEGEKSYRNVLNTLESLSSVDRNSLISEACCDIGTNMLLQSRVLHDMCYIDQTSVKEMKGMLNRCIEYFSKAINVVDCDSARAWNGIGCALTLIDPLLAQHAFCRALEIDSALSDSWANIGLLYIQSGHYVKSGSVFDMLTQVESPILWLGKAYLFVEEALSEQSTRIREDLFKRAADAFRASLLQGTFSLGLLGLSMTTRRATQAVAPSTDEYFGAESFSYQRTYFDLMGKKMSLTAFCGALMTCEKGLHLLRNSSYHIGQEVIRAGMDELNDASKQIEKLEDIYENAEIETLVLKEITDIIGKKVELQSIHLSCRQILSPLLDNNTLGLNRKSSSHPLSSIASSQRDVLLYPWDGQMWLSLAKKLVVKVTSSESPSMNIVNAAFSATEEAKRLLKRNSIIKPGFSESKVTGCMLSEALALTAWIGLLHRQDDASKCLCDIQRALILDPENKIARLWLLKTK